MMERLPPQSLVERELLLLLHNTAHPVRTNKIYYLLAGKFGLSRLERFGRPHDPRGSCWELLVRRTRRHLQDQGLLLATAPGCWALTYAGHAMASGMAPDAVIMPDCARSA